MLQLDLRSLLVSAQRVCTSWYLTVATSPSLQCALFLRADFSRPSSCRYGNPLLQEVFPSWFGSDYPPCPKKKSSERHSNEMPKEQQVFNSLPLCRSSQPRGARNSSFLRPEASWKRMLISQPPIRRLHIYDEEIHMFGISSHLTVKQLPCITMRKLDGKLTRTGRVEFRMGEFYDLVLGKLSNCHIKTFMASWNGDSNSRKRFREHPMGSGALMGKDTLSKIIGEEYELALAFYWTHESNM
jgi:hypothetical protein